jgi:thiol-disulfide isomerase/thioredoxin
MEFVPPMPHPSFRPLSSLSLTLALSALALAGCDRDASPKPQEKAGAAATAASPGDEGLTGKVDRSHAGELMPAVNLVDPSGAQLNLGAAQGKPMLLNLWATWCAPCVKEMPLLDALAGEYGDRLRVIVASQDLEGKAKVVPFFAEKKFAHLHPWIDPKTALSFEFGGGQLPTTVLYDASGAEVARVTGGFDWSGPEAHALVDEAVSKAP